MRDRYCHRSPAPPTIIMALAQVSCFLQQSDEYFQQYTSTNLSKRPNAACDRTTSCEFIVCMPTWYILIKMDVVEYSYVFFCHDVSKLIRMSHVTFQTLFLQGNVGLDTLSSLFTLDYINHALYVPTVNWIPPPPPPPLQAMITDEGFTPLSCFAFDAVWVLASAMNASAMNTTCPINNTLPQNLSVNGTTVSDSSQSKPNSVRT